MLKEAQKQAEIRHLLLRGEYICIILHHAEPPGDFTVLAEVFLFRTGSATMHYVCAEYRLQPIGL